MMTIIESSRLQPNFRKSWAIRGTDLYVLLLQSQMHDPEASPLGSLSCSVSQLATIKVQFA